MASEVMIVTTDFELSCAMSESVGEEWRLHPLEPVRTTSNSGSMVVIRNFIGTNPPREEDTMVTWRVSHVKKNVTHRLFTHRLHAANMTCDAARHPNPLWPRHPAHSRRAGDQSGRGCRALRAAPDLLQRN